MSARLVLKTLFIAILLAASLNSAKAASLLTLSGSANPATGIIVDDDLDVYLNGIQIYTDAFAGAGTRPPISVMASAGDILRFVVRDTFGVCSSLSTVFLTNASGQGVLADPGFNRGCGLPNTDQGVTHDRSFTIPDLDFRPKPGDIVAIGGGGTVLKVDPITGLRTVITNFTNPLQGPTYPYPGGLTAGACGAIYVTDQLTDEVGKLYRVFPDGTRSLVSDAANPQQGNPWHTPYGLGLDSDGSILVTDRGIGGGGNFSGLWSVNASTGFRTRITDSGTANGGHSAPESVMLDAGGTIVMGDAEGPIWLGAGSLCFELGDCGALFRVNRGTGALTVLSDFGNLAQGPRGEDGGHSIALDTDGSVLVLDPFVQIGGHDGAMFRVNLSSGTRTVLTTGLPHYPSVAVGTDGTILIAGCPSPIGGSPAGALCRVDRVTGAQTVLSDFFNPAQGPLYGPVSIAVVGTEDLDGDGYGSPASAACAHAQLDCNDTNANIYPDAPEINDGRDNQCPGEPGYGVIDEISGQSQFPVANDKTRFEWDAQSGATAYQVVRSTAVDFSSGCTVFATSQPFIIDADVPPPGGSFYYLVRATAPSVGSWGQLGDGTQRTVPCVP